MNLKDLLNGIDRALFPPAFTCDLCGAETFGTGLNANFCKNCIKELTFNNIDVCPVCGRKTGRNELCMECKAKPPLFKKAISPLVYENGAVKLIAKFKKGNGYLKEYFASIMADGLQNMPPFDLILYVPMTKKAVSKRGYNQSELLAYGISKRVNVEVGKNILVKTKETPEQKSLSGKERLANLTGCFKVENRAAVKGKSILLVDDVLTTGATADTISKKLLGAGAKCVYLVTIASVEYKPAHKNKK